MTKTKKLQKVTDFDHISTKKELREYLESNPESHNKVLENLMKRTNESYANKLGEEHKLMEMICECFRISGDKRFEVQLRNTTYEANHSMITSTIHNYILENRKFPTIEHISNESGLSRMTVYRHLNDGLKTEYNTLVKGKMECMATAALEKLYLIGVQDNNAAALKTFIELSGAVGKSTASNINNYIQINNLKISKDEFDQLPNDTIVQIEKLISENLTKPYLEMPK